jgi:hypothetical protein
MSRHKQFGLLSITTLATLALLVPSIGAADSVRAPKVPPKQSQVVTPTGAAPTPSEVAASALMRWIDAHPDSSSGGVSVDQTRVLVHWKGEVPPDLAALARGQKAPVTFLEARYSAEELRIAAKKVAQDNPDLIASVGPREDFSGLVAQTTPSAGGRLRNQSRKLVLPAIPLKLDGTATLTTAQSRDADISPFWGSALIFHRTSPSSNTGFACSAGIPVHIGATSYMTTADHCGNGKWQGYASGALLGTIDKDNKDLDTELINTNSASYIYKGPWNSTQAVPIYDAERPANHSKVCTSGGVTGEFCSQTSVAGIMMFANIKDVGLVGPGFWILTQDIQNNRLAGIVHGGDSGSAAYAYTANSQASVRGLVVALDESFATARCNPNPDFPSTPSEPCSARAFAVNARDANAAFGAYIKTVN